MSDKKMTETEIMNALKECEGCHLTVIEESHRKQNGELRKEVERLTKENHHFADIGKFYSEIKAEARAEAIKEFAERAKIYKRTFYEDSLDANYYEGTAAVTIDKIDQIAKEMGVDL